MSEPSPFHNAHRRAVITGAAALPVTSLLGGVAAAPAGAATPDGIAEYDPALVPSAAVLGGWMKQLHDFGPIRFTGTPECRAFEEWLATRFGELGCAIERDQFRLTSWRCRLQDCSISVREDSGRTRSLEVVAYYPFAASTRGRAAVTGRVLFAGSGDEAGKALAARTPRQELAESIVVLHMPVAGMGPDRVTQYFPESFPNPLPTVLDTRNPGGAAFQAQPSMEALEGRCRGIVFCYSDVSNAAARYNFLPFTDKHRGTSALWVGADDARYLQQVSGKATVTLRCDAELTPNARADTILATLPGESDEVVLMTTQTDGPNECNENGALGLLAAATYVAKVKRRRRTFVFSLPTGHYASGPVRDPVTGSGRAAGTAGVLAKWPHLRERAVAQIALEQLGAREWVDLDGKWQGTGRPAMQHWIPTPATAAPIRKLFMAAMAGEDPRFARATLVKGGFPGGGEGGGLRREGVPGIGLMGTPDYFFRADPSGVLDKLDPRIMHLEVSVAIKLLVLFDRLTSAQLKGLVPITDADIRG